MNCENIRELLNAYIDGILSDKDRAVVESHLQTCNDCRNELDELKAAIKLVRGMDRIVPPPWFAEQVMSKVREDAVKEKGIIQSLFYPLHIKVPIQAFATVVVAILAVVIYKYSVPEVKQPVFQPALQQTVQQAPAVQPQENYGKLPAEAPKPATEKLTQAPVQGLPEQKTEKKDETIQPPAPSKGAPSSQPPKKNLGAAEEQNIIQYHEMKMKDETSGGENALNSDSMAKAGTPELQEDSTKKEQAKDEMSPDIEMRAAPAPVMIDVSITAPDVDKEIKAVIKVIESAKARLIGKYSTGMDTFIMAETAGNEAKKIIDKLKQSADVNVITKNVDAYQGRVTLRIKIVGKTARDNP